MLGAMNRFQNQAIPLPVATIGNQIGQKTSRIPDFTFSLLWVTKWTTTAYATAKETQMAITKPIFDRTLRVVSGQSISDVPVETTKIVVNTIIHRRSQLNDSFSTMGSLNI